MPFLPPNQQRQSTEGTAHTRYCIEMPVSLKTAELMEVLFRKQICVLHIGLTVHVGDATLCQITVATC